MKDPDHHQIHSKTRCSYKMGVLSGKRRTEKGCDEDCWICMLRVMPGDDSYTDE